MRGKRSSEEQAIVLMKLLTNWLNFWIESKEEEPIVGFSADFGIVQIEGLQRCLERVKRKLEKEKN
jgi:hypothetical protein